MRFRWLPTCLLLLGAASAASAQTVSLTLRDGRVTLITQNATPAAILAEWARQGQTRVVDAERVPATPLTLRLENVAERDALDIVLRGAAGYVAAPRLQATGAQSRFDRILVMATSPGATVARATGGRSTATATAAPPPAMPQQVDEEAATAAAAAAGLQPTGPEDGTAGAGTGGVVAGGEQPASSTNFDYANPQRYFAARQAEQQATADDGTATATGINTQPTPTPGPFGPTRSTPGMLPMPATPNQPGATAGTVPINPYGLPANQSPGSSPAAPQLEPDRSKYINPYSPTPPRPPNDQ